jgi:hypothetical protein
LADRASLSVREHLDLDNTFSWKLFNTNLSWLAIYSEKDLELAIRSESTWVQLDPNDKAEYVEPSAGVFEHDASRLREKREEIYRQMHLLSQGKSSTAVASAQSGFSKEMDLAPAHDVQESFGDRLRGWMKEILQDAALAVGVELDAEVRGFNFTKQDVDETIRTTRDARELELQSDTLYEELEVALASQLMQDASSETIAKVVAEIRAGKKRSVIVAEREAQMREEAQAAFAGV